VQIDQDNLVTHTARYGFFRYWRFCEKGGITWIPIALTNNARKFGPELSCVKCADHGSGEEVARYSCRRRESRNDDPTGTGHSRSLERHRESARFHPNMIITVHQNERDWERYHDQTVDASLGYVHGRCNGITLRETLSIHSNLLDDKATAITGLLHSTAVEATVCSNDR
jgi:hypothetical protein